MYCSSRRGQLVDPELTHVATVDVTQLALVEHGRVLGDALEPEALGELAQREVLLVGGEARAEQRDVVVDRLGQVARVAQLLHRGGTVAL